MWYPQFDTYFEKNIPDLDQHLQGRFEDVMYNMTEWPTYNIWNHGITGIKTYHNTDEEASPEKILFITESFSDVVMPFLSCNYSNIDEIDLRCFTGSLQNYIEKSEPDMVVVLYSAYDFNSGTHMDLFNFS